MNGAKQIPPVILADIVNTNVLTPQHALTLVQPQLQPPLYQFVKGVVKFGRKKVYANRMILNVKNGSIVVSNASVSVGMKLVMLIAYNKDMKVVNVLRKDVSVLEFLHIPLQPSHLPPHPPLHLPSPYLLKDANQDMYALTGKIIQSVVRSFMSHPFHAMRRDGIFAANLF